MNGRHGIIGHVHNALDRAPDAGLRAARGERGRGRAWHLPTVKTDNFNLGRLGARYFLDVGFKHFAFYARAPELYTRERADGYSLELMKVGLKCRFLKIRRHKLGPSPAAFEPLAVLACKARGRVLRLRSTRRRWP